MIKTIFFGTPDFVIPILESILQVTRFNLVSVITNPDRPVGRKQITTPSPVKQWAIEHDIPVLTPKNLDNSFQDTVNSIQPKIGILAAYGKIIPKEIIDLFSKGILVIHPSLLPKYRGASPVQTAIVRGDKETGVSIIKMDEQMDHGPIIAQFNEPIKPDDTTESLCRRLFHKTADFLPAVLEHYIFACDRVKESMRIFLPPRRQNHSQATYTKVLKKEDGFIPYGIIASKPGSTSKCKKIAIPFIKGYSLSPTPQALERFIRAMSPWPGCWTEVTIQDRQAKPILDRKSRKRLKILKAHVENKKLVLDLVQLEGKNPVSWEQFAQNYLYSIP